MCIEIIYKLLSYETKQVIYSDTGVWKKCVECDYNLWHTSRQWPFPRTENGDQYVNLTQD